MRLHYVNRKTRPFVEDLVLRERFLISLIDQIAQEIHARGPEAWKRSRTGFDLVYQRGDSLFAEYDRELDRLLTIASKLDSLERRALGMQRLDLVWGIRDLKTRIAAAIDNMTPEIDDAQRRLLLLRRVDYEIDRLVEIYDELQELKQTATAEERYDVVSDATACQNRILEVISTWGKTEPVDKTVLDQYMYELSRLVKILREVDAIREQAAGLSPTLEQLAIELRQSLLSQLRPEVLEAFGYSEFTRGETIPLSQLLEEWEKSEWVDYELARTFYEIIYRKLLDSGTPSERERMLERALDSGVQAYARGEYSLARLHFAHAIDLFPAYGFKLTPVRFYLAECWFAEGHYGEAKGLYEDIAFRNGDLSKYIALSAYRLLCLAHLGQQVDLDRAYAAFSARDTVLDAETRAAGHFLAGLRYLEESRPLDAARALELVPGKATVTIQSRFLRGVALVQIRDYESARSIFKQLAELRDKPGRGYFEALIGNAALVKLGLMAYEEGNYHEAVEYLERVSADYPEYDQALLGLAWSYLKQGDYRSPIPPAEEIFQRFVRSEYVYEALVLAAHCKRVLGQQEDALENLRYVTNARAVEDLAREWARERLRLARVNVALDSLERVVLERGDEQLYPHLREAREQTEFALWLLEHPGPAGVRLLQQFNSERSRIATLMARLDRIRDAAEQLGRKDVVYQADRVQHRLLKTIETYDADLALTRVNHFIDYPLALRESTSRYVASLLDSIEVEAALEQLRLATIQARLDSLQSVAFALGQENVAFEAEFWSTRLQSLASDVSQAQAWIASRDVEVVDADFNRWADFSGFGMSDITLTLLRDREQRIARYSEMVQTIDRILEKRKRALENSLVALSEQIQNLEYQLQQLRLAETREKQQRYFEEQYFDRTTSEQPEAKDNRNSMDSVEEGTGKNASPQH